jgi:antitoxin (DNA-binding transcriptional repressor) of toxin-antitoxin stability system
MSTVTVQELERDPRSVLHRVEAGESITVVRGDQPVAEVRPAASKRVEARPFALAAGQFTVPADFDEPLPDDILREFEGR